MSRLVSVLPSPSLVVACVALLLVLGGTSGAAVSQAPPKNSVGTNQLKNNAVTTPKIKNNAVAATKIASNADLADGVLPPSAALGRFVNGPVAIPTAQTTVASLTIPAAGNYVVWAKAYLTSALLDGVITCRLEAGSNFDETRAYVAADEPAAMSLMVLNNFTAAGTVNVACSAPTAKQANFIKITAVQFTTLSNTG
jgi:hypothetical protein